MSARSAVALQAGADDEVLDAVDDGPGRAVLSAEQQAALRLADAYLSSPSSLTDDDRRSIATQLSSAEIVGLTLRLVSYSHDKVMVALGLDLDEVQPFTFE